MSMSSNTRFGGNAPGLPAAPLGVLSRRAAMLGAVTVAGLGGAIYPAARGHAAQLASMVPASLDAELVAHADRLANLARRCDAVVERRADLEDRLSDLCPRPVPLPQPSAFSIDIQEPKATERVITATKSATYDQEWAEWERATAAAKATYEQQRATARARLGLPAVERRCACMEHRRDRWAADLAEMKPATAAGLAAKASALLELLGTDRFSHGVLLADHADLVVAVLRDAARLGTGALS